MHAVYQLIVLFVTLALYEHIPYFNFKGKSHEYISTLVFNSFVFMQVFNELNSRHLGNALNPFSGLLTNKIFLAVMVFTVVVQALIVQFGGEITSTIPLDCDGWMYSIVVGAICIPYGIVSKLVVRVEDEIVAREPVKKITMSASQRWKMAAQKATQRASVIKALRGSARRDISANM